MLIDYYWNKGIPIGIKGSKPCYRILREPFGRYYMIEQIKENKFEKVVYDSRQLDFSKLKERDQMGWCKETIDHNQVLIRDRDHFPKHIEKYFFQKNKPLHCELFSLQGSLIASQKIYYKSLNHAFNGVILFDSLGKQVIKKCYSVDVQDEFLNLIAIEY